MLSIIDKKSSVKYNHYMNIQQAIDKCVLMAHTDRSPNTAKAYKNGIDKFGESLERKGLTTADNVGTITLEQFIEFPAWLSSNKYSKQTLRVYTSGAKFFLEWLVIGGYIEPPDYKQSLRYQMAYRTVVRKHDSRFIRFPQRGEAEKMLAAVLVMEKKAPMLERDIAIIHFLYYTGCRNNEVAQLDITDIDMNDLSAVVVGKGNKERRVYFSQDVADKLRRYWELRGHSNPQEPVFCRHDRGVGKKIKRLTTTSIRNIVDDVCMVAGIDKGQFTPHYFRHAFAIKMLRETKNLSLLQDLLGHASPASTRVYAKIYPDDLKKAHQEAFSN